MTLSDRRLAGLVTLCLSTSGAAVAAAEDALPVYRLGETLMVVGERPRVADTAATVDVVTSEEIARRGVRTLDEAIALLPGVYVRYGADGVPRVDIRGLRTRNVLLLQDGVPLNSTYDGQFDPSAIPVDNIAAIKVTRGASSVLYGPGGNAGVIEIVTRSAGRSAEGGVLTESEVSQSWLARGSVSGRIADRLQADDRCNSSRPTRSSVLRRRTRWVTGLPLVRLFLLRAPCGEPDHVDRGSGLRAHERSPGAVLARSGARKSGSLP